MHEADTLDKRSTHLVTIPRMKTEEDWLIGLEKNARQGIVLGLGEIDSWLPLLDYFSPPKIRRKKTLMNPWL